MELQDIDKAFKVSNTINKSGMIYFRIPNENFSLYGVYYDETYSRFLRMDWNIASQVNDGVKLLAPNTSGGRIRFATDSKKFEISVTYDELVIMSHMAIEGSSGFMLIEENEDGATSFYKMLPPTSEQKAGYTLSIDLPGEKIRNYILWFPLYNGVSSLTIGLEEKALVNKGREYRDIKPIL